MDERSFEIISIIAARKTEFYRSVEDQFISRLPDEIDLIEARKKLRDAIADLPDMLFVSPEEMRSKTLTPGLSVHALNLDQRAITNAVISALSDG
jgi:hypothetical protein